MAVGSGMGMPGSMSERCLGTLGKRHVSAHGLRLWETLHIDIGLLGDGDARASEEVRLAAACVRLVADESGFTVVSDASCPLRVLVTLMAKAEGADPVEARTRLSALTAGAGGLTPLRARADTVDVYARLWLDDLQTHERSGRWTAIRSGAVVVPLSERGSFTLSHDAEALRTGVVVAAVAAVGLGDESDEPLSVVDRGASATIGERPALPGR